MKLLGYHRPQTLEEACDLLTRLGPRARPIAGGTAVANLLKVGLLDVDHLVSLERLPLREVEWRDGALYVGAMTTLQSLADHPLVRARLPILAEVAGLVASRRVRNVATLGGNLCWAEAASDPPGVLMALDADVAVQSSRGRRTIAVRELFRDYFTTVLEEDEIVSGVRIPTPRDAGVAYIKFTPQSKADKPVLAVTALVRRRGDGLCAGARVVVGAAGPTPMGLLAADAALEGERVDGPATDRVARDYAAAAQPVSDTRGSEAYKRRMIEVLVRRAIHRAWARAEVS